MFSNLLQQGIIITGEMPGVGLRPGPTDKRIDSQMFFLKRADTNKEHSEGGEGDLNIDYAERMKKNIEKYYNKEFNTTTGKYDDNSQLKVANSIIFRSITNLSLYSSVVKIS